MDNDNVVNLRKCSECGTMVQTDSRFSKLRNILCELCFREIVFAFSDSDEFSGNEVTVS
jgi:hypothetical protein